jgi:hypothetical protein
LKNKRNLQFPTDAADPNKSLTALLSFGTCVRLYPQERRTNVTDGHNLTSFKLIIVSSEEESKYIERAGK